MKTAYILLLIASTFIYQHVKIAEKHLYEKVERTNTGNIPEQDSLNYIESFAAFRNAVSKNDKAKVKSFFDFPVIDNVDLWYLIKSRRQEMDQPEGNRPFTEKDFDIHYYRIFDKKFVNTILKIKTDELKKKGESESTKFTQDKSTTYSMYASVDTAERTLQLSLGFRRVVKDKHGRIEDNEEYGTVYVFSILKNGQLKFKKIMMTA